MVYFFFFYPFMSTLVFYCSLFVIIMHVLHILDILNTHPLYFYKHTDIHATYLMHIIHTSLFIYKYYNFFYYIILQVVGGLIYTYETYKSHMSIHICTCNTIYLIKYSYNTYLYMHTTYLIYQYVINIAYIFICQHIIYMYRLSGVYVR